MREPKKRERWGDPLGGLLNPSYNRKLGWPWHRINQPTVYRQTTEDVVEGLHYAMFEPLGSDESMGVNESFSTIPIDQLYERQQVEGGWTLEQIAELFDVTRERVRQIESKALRKLRKYFSQQSRQTVDDAGELIDKCYPVPRKEFDQGETVKMEKVKKDEYPKDVWGDIIWPKIPVLYHTVRSNKGPWQELRRIDEKNKG